MSKALNKISINEAQKKFNLDEFWRPKKYVVNEYADNGDGTIFDEVTGLTWEQSGSSDYIYFKDVPSYAKEQNIKKLGGYDDWRLPTVKELLSLVEPDENAKGLYIDPIFGKKHQWIWSSDLRSGGGAWVVIFDLGAVHWLQGSYRYVRLVRRGQ